MPELDPSQNPPAAPAATPVSAAPPSAPMPTEEELEIQTIPDQFYGTALKAKAPAVVVPDKKPPEPEGSDAGKKVLPVWLIPAIVGVVLLLGVAGGFWYFNPGFFAPKPPPVVTPEPEPEPEPEPPLAPLNVQATSTEGGSVRVTWEDMSSNEAGFRVERREPSGPFAPVTSAPPNTTLFLDTTTAWESSYIYRVIAVNQDGEAPSANEASIILPENPVKPVEPMKLPPAGLDTDSDGLTDLEEPLYGSPLRDPDADKDTFLDGNEVFHLYTPSGKAPGRLLDSGLVRQIESSMGWRLYVPVTWQATIQPDGALATILTGNGELFRVTVTSRAPGSSIMDWYLAQNPGTLSSQVQTLTTKGGLEGIQGAEYLFTYFPWGNDKVLVLEYSLEGQPFVNFRTTYEMLRNSLSLDPLPTINSTPEPAPVPPNENTEEGVSSASSTEAALAP